MKLVFINLFLNQKKENAIKFQRWIFEEVLPSIRKTGSYEITSKPKIIPPFTTEIDLSFTIKSWIDLCIDNARFNIEIPLINNLDNKTKTRRIDFIKSNGRNVIAYELKLNEVTLTDVASTIGDKSYYHLCKNQYNRPVKFIFLSPKGISDSAINLLDTMPDITFKSVSDLCVDAYLKGINKKWINSSWYLNKQVLDNKFINLFDTQFLNLIKSTNSN